MASGDVRLLVNQITKVAGTEFSDLDFCPEILAGDTNANVNVVPREQTGDTVVYDVVCSSIATA